MSIKQEGGMVNNPANTTISGYTYRVEIYGAAGTVTNSGMITSNSVSTGFAVYLQDGGTVTNSGVIFGGGPKGQGVKLLSGKVNNESRGVIQGFTYAVDMGGGTVTNNAGGSIVAAEVGVAFQLNAGSLTNAGVINVQPVVQSTSVFGVLAFIGPGVDVVNSGSITATGTGQNNVYGVKIATNAYLTNTGTIMAQDGTKSWGVYLWNVAGGAATVVNSGTITGATAAIQFGAKTNKLILETRSVLNGAAIGSTSKGATNALVLEGSGTANNAFLNLNTLSVMASGTSTMGGALKIGATTVTTGSLDIAGALTTNMTEAAAASVIVGVGGALTLTAASTLSGAFSVQADSLVTLSGGALTLTGTATFSGGRRRAPERSTIPQARRSRI